MMCLLRANRSNNKGDERMIALCYIYVPYNAVITSLITASDSLLVTGTQTWCLKAVTFEQRYRDPRSNRGSCNCVFRSKKKDWTYQDNISTHPVTDRCFNHNTRYKPRHVFATCRYFRSVITIDMSLLNMLCICTMMWKVCICTMMWKERSLLFTTDQDIVERSPYLLCHESWSVKQVDTFIIMNV